MAPTAADYQDQRVDVAEKSQVGEARRRAVSVARAAGLDDGDAGRVAIVATESASNLVKHGTGGEVLLRPLGAGGVPGVELIAIDRGPGFDPGRALRDGYSTAGTPGTGLGAVQRLSDVFELFTAPNSGTVLLSRIFAGRRLPPEDPCVGVVCVATRNEQVCGDGWAVAQGRRGEVTLLVVDGLGHGQPAHDAARAALDCFAESHALDVPEILDACHGALLPTRGAAVAIAKYRPAHGEVRFAGVGNIMAIALTGERRQNMVSMNGIVGHGTPSIREFTYPVDRDVLLLMCSDGLTSRWDVSRYPGLASREPALIAATLYRDFVRGRDDATVLACRPAPAAGARMTDTRTLE